MSEDKHWIKALWRFALTDPSRDALHDADECGHGDCACFPGASAVAVERRPHASLVDLDLPHEAWDHKVASRCAVVLVDEEGRRHRFDAVQMVGVVFSSEEESDHLVFARALRWAADRLSPERDVS